MKRTATAAACATAALLAAFLTGCSGSGSDSGASSSGDTATASPTQSAAAPAAVTVQPTVATKSAGKLGTILVDGKGRTLYLFVADKKKNTSTCSGGCAVAWPPLLTTGSAKAGKGADAKLFGTVKRSGGLKQVSYNGHPLYYYVGDSAKPGQTSGQGINQFGALWYVLNAKGDQVTS